ncbi:MAG: trypsin-like peptidase domain-containing protein [Bacteroidia bacterium]|nr:trypsin-like peptidase domain-containing protein [Bacteroidia bacterium]
MALPLIGISQINFGGQPLGLSKSVVEKSIPLPITQIDKVNHGALNKEDRLKGTLNRFAAPVNTNYTLDNSGSWIILPNGDRLWRLYVSSEGAIGLSVLYRKFRLPEGAKLFFYSPDGKQIKGSYTHLNNRGTEKFMTGIIRGEEGIIEYYEPKSVEGLGYFEIYKVFRVYNAVAFDDGSKIKAYAGPGTGFGDSSDCHDNINCSEGDDWQTYKSGVARVMMVFENAMGWCTGTLMNNVRQDQTPYILTAYHCQNAENPLYDHWQFDFNYETTGCTNPTQEPSSQSVQGCSLKTGREESDFLLVQLNNALPSNFDVSYHGWDRSESVPDTVAMIHHPAGDIMKVSVANGGVTILGASINWNTGVTTPPNHHFRFELTTGAFETGSSGCALFNKQGRIVGQLNGGTAMCTGSITYVGRLFQSWNNTLDNNGLQPFLDPDNTGVATLDMLAPVVDDVVSISGNVQSINNVNMANMEVRLSGDTILMTTTDANGNFTFSDLTKGGNFVVTPVKDNSNFNGIGTGDLLRLQRHILGIIEFDEIGLFVAADASNNNRVSTGDLLQIQRLILGIYTTFPNNSSWRFYTTDYDTGDSKHPLEQSAITGSRDSISYNNLLSDTTNAHFLGVKVGDTSKSADPNN